MVLPVTGPISAVVNTPSLYSSRQRWKQAKPFNLPLDYLHDYCKLLTEINGAPLTSTAPVIASLWKPVDGNIELDLSNRCYDKLRGSVADKAEMGINIVQAGQAVGMVAGRAIQIAGIANDIRKFNFVAAARKLKLPGVPKGASTKKALAGNWLEFSFGWRPLVQDIYGAIDVLQNPLKANRPKSKTRTFYQKEFVSGSVPSDYRRERYDFELVCKMGCSIEIDNPNLFLANSLGLVNPAYVAWDSIPFSFVVDWFVNVGQFLSQGTDWLGLRVTNSWTLKHYKALCFVDQNSPNPGWGFSAKKYQVVWMERKPGLVGPSLIVRPFKIWGWQRAANAVGVVTQVFGRK